MWHHVASRGDDKRGTTGRLVVAGGDSASDIHGGIVVAGRDSGSDFHSGIARAEVVAEVTVIVEQEVVA